MRPIEVTSDEYWDYHKAFNYPPNEIESYLKIGIDVERMYENLKKTGMVGDYRVKK